MKKIWILLAMLLCSQVIFGQELRRRTSLGIQQKAVSDSLAQGLSMKEAKGTYVIAVRPNGSADVMEVEAGDVILGIKDSLLDTPEALDAYLKTKRGGDEITMLVWRGGKEVALEGMLLNKAEESSGYGTVLYGEAPFKEGKLRTITIKPDLPDQRFPSLLFIPAYPCESIDNLPPWHPYKKLVEALVEQGIAVMRVEKSGLGDAVQTPDCKDLTIEEEIQGFKSGYEALLDYDFVDTNNIFIMGHALGGVMAPVLAADTALDPKGVIVYGTFLESWMEYLIGLMRHQAPKLGGDYLEIEENRATYMKVLSQLYLENKSPQEVAKADSSLGVVLRQDFQWDGEEMILGRHYRFWQSLDELNLAKAWAETDAYVYSIFGEADAKTLDPRGHQQIVSLVNTYHPDKAEFYAHPATNHIFLEVGSMEAGIAASKDPQQMFGLYQSSFSYLLTERIADWIRSKLEE